MKEISRTESVVSEAAVLVGVFLAERDRSLSHLDHELVPLEELEGLAEAAGTQVVGKLTQRREAPDAATYLGKGKVEELAALAHAEMADVVIFDNDLSPGQTRNLEKAIGLKVLDRTELILDIFASRAQTHEARLAVELAQLEYAMPRLKRMWTHLSRQKKGASACAGRAKPSWKKTAGWSKTGSTTCGGSCTRSSTPPARGGRAASADDRLAGRLHQRRQEHADERPDRRRRVHQGRAVRHARHAHPPLAVARLGAGAA